MTTINKTFSNNINCYYNQKRAFPPRASLTKDEKRKLDKENATNQKKNRARELFNSNNKPFNYFFTITSGLPDVRNNPNLLRKKVKEYLDSNGISTYCFVVQRNHPRTDFVGECKGYTVGNPNEYHVHGLSSIPVNLLDWADDNACSTNALYHDEIRDIDKSINYLIRDLHNLPQKFHGCCASYKRKKAKKNASEKNARIVKTDRYDPMAIIQRFRQTSRISLSEIKCLINAYLELVSMGGSEQCPLKSIN